MSDNGFTKSFRRKWNHEAFKNWHEASVWAWMIDFAVWEPKGRTIETSAGPLHLKRGQLLIAQQMLADNFNMSRKVVRRVLKSMEDAGMMRLETGHEMGQGSGQGSGQGRTKLGPGVGQIGTVCTILKYNTYQSHTAGDEKAEASPNDEAGQAPPPDGPGSGQAKGQQDKEKKDLNEKKEVKDAPPGAVEGSGYAFEGQLIKLVAKDLTKWETDYPNLAKLGLLRSTLSRYDGYLVGQGVKKSEWWNRTQNYLAAEERKAAVELQAGLAKARPASVWPRNDDYIDPDEFPIRNPDVISDSELAMFRGAESVE